MSVLEEKIDIMARILLGETDAKSELKSLLDKSRKRSRTELIHEAMKELGVPSWELRTRLSGGSRGNGN